MDINNEENVRIVVINISNVLGSSVYDEANTAFTSVLGVV